MSIAAVKARVDRWFVATLGVRAGRARPWFAPSSSSAGVEASAIREFDDVAHALDAARGDVGEADRIIVFGSFLTVAAALAAATAERGRAPNNG